MKKAIVLIGVIFIVLGGKLYGQGFENFISVDGNKLMDGSNEYRFISFNVPTLNFQEDEMAYKETNPYALPTEYEMRDVFATVKEMGGQVIRIYTIPVRNTNFPHNAPTYVEGPGEFNEEAFKVTDKMLQLANEYNVRIIFSLLNNRQWMGGRPNYAAFRGKTEDEFWTDPQLIEDFKKTLEFVINRKNTYTGIRYKDDKSILCWETGNELTSPIEWTINITRYIKSLDKNHLVMDGWYSDDLDYPFVREASLNEWSIDMVSSHHYERNAIDVPKNIQKNIEIIKKRKPYLVGEFGFISTSGTESVLDYVIDNNDVCGALIWSLRHHRKDGGFYWHSEPLGAGVFKAYHWPGFVSGEKYDEANLMNMYRNKAYEIQEKEIPPVSVPLTPELLPIKNVHSISWRGAMGATGYNVYRSVYKTGPWEIVGYNISDADVPYFPLFHDKTAELGKSYYYSVSAINRSGSSEKSNVVGPVKVDVLAKIDLMKNLGNVEDSKAVVPITGGDRSFKEIRNRLYGDYGSELIYKIPEKLDGFKLYAFEKKRFRYLAILGSLDGETWTDLDIFPESFTNNESNYGYWRPKIYRYSGGANYKYIKIQFKGGIAQLARVEITYR
ncbi:cellulase family glycosylhydrolase [uncultured Draconibacterium sp.]|uniref:cellulase family glycosylhydrolase n=1 Tax=uncultured Draconibacterium sp. TaxID=1573823 RepID=UPI0029C04092|nr:cellulase family glycosylhydrolase [uncultured Draconibacterium sp.]